MGAPGPRRRWRARLGARGLGGGEGALASAPPPPSLQRRHCCLPPPFQVVPRAPSTCRKECGGADGGISLPRSLQGAARRWTWRHTEDMVCGVGPFGLWPGPAPSVGGGLKDLKGVVPLAILVIITCSLILACARRGVTRGGR